MSRRVRHDWFLSRVHASRRQTTKRQAPTLPFPFHRRLRIEPLEDRRLLAVVTVNTLNDTVDLNDGVTSLREAIFAANTVAGADTIEFAASLTSGGPATVVLTQGELAITDSLTINGPGANLLTIDASGNDPTPDVNNGDGSRVFNIDDGNSANVLDVSISGLTLTGGDVAALGSAGAIFSRENLTLTGSTITGNSAGRNGGGIYSRDGSLMLTGSTISGNSANGSFSFGGGIYVRGGNLTLVGTTISGNTASDGGGIRVRDGNLALIGTTISGNSAGGSTAGSGTGGGILISSTASLVPPIVTITDSTISGNSAAREGGGIRLSLPTNGSLTVSNSTISGNMAGDDGGGVRLTGGTAFITDSTMSGNSSAGDGGAISKSSGNLTVIRSTFVGNSALGTSPNSRYGRGGAIWSSGGSSGTLTVTDSTISGNSANGTASSNSNIGGGGGIWSSDSLMVVTKSTISGNSTVRHGGGILKDRGNLTVSGSTISGNSASGSSSDGGGIYIGRYSTMSLIGTTISGNSALAGGGISSAGTLVVTDSLLQGNTAGVGGGIRQVNGSLTVENSTISGNTAASNSGALYLLLTTGSSEFDVRHSTIVNNSASGFGGGISVFGGSLNLDHTILAQNSAMLGRDLMPFLGAVIDARFSLISDNANSGLAEAPVGSPDATGNLIGSSPSSYIFPQLAPLGDNGGMTMTHALFAESPAINAGDPSAASGVGTVPEFDQRGAPFGRLSGGRIDIGAYGRQSLPGLTLAVDTLADESDGNYLAGDLSLREAIGLANGSTGGDAITFAPSLTSSGPATILLTQGELKVTDALAITGPGAKLLTIDASGNDPTPDVSNLDGSRVLSIADAYPFSITIDVSISGLTLTGGDVAYGGAIDTNENLTVINSTISGNSGGGIYKLDSRLTVIDSTISGNSSVGDFRGGITSVHGTLIVTNSVIAGNSTTRSGGGIFISSLNSGASATVTVTNSTISGNSAGGNGGGIYINGGSFGPFSLTITNSTISGNSADFAGGGIFAVNMRPTLSNSIVAGNTRGAGEANDVSANVNLAFSLLGVNTGATITDNGGNLIGTAAAPIDPLLGPLADNGGPTMTHALLPGSPAIDAGSGGSGFDQRGAPFSRVVDGNGDGVAQSDIGAFESQPMPSAFFGDYNGNGSIDAADYVVWRKTLGGNVAPYSGADGNGNGIVDQGDHVVWRAHFGQTIAAGSGATTAALSYGTSAWPPSASLEGELVKMTSMDRDAGGQTTSAYVPIAPAVMALVTPAATHRLVGPRSAAETVTARRDDALVAWLAAQREPAEPFDDLGAIQPGEHDSPSRADGVTIDFVDECFALLAND